MKKFRLLSFEHDELGETNSYQFSPDKKLNYDLPYSTLLIGPNGTGKSRLLRVLADVFNDLFLFYNDGHNVKRNELFVTKENYILSYSLNGIKYKFIKTGGSGLGYEINGKGVSYDQMRLPSKLICVSYNISDKFPVTFSSPLLTRKDRYDNNFYHYLGIKVHRNSATPSAHIYRTLDLLTSKIDNPSFRRNANSIFRFLELKPTIRLEYSPGFLTSRENFLSGDLTTQKFKTRVTKLTKEGRLGYSLETFEKLLDDELFLKRFINYLNSFARKKRKRQLLEFDFSKERFISRQNKYQYQFLNLARRLRIVSYRDILLSQVGYENFSFKDSSSGQSHILTSMLSLASVINDHSLVLIDEPETSLHPNWQMKYFDLIYTAFQEFNSCHFVVASHSHFLSSDLRPESSSILSLSRDENFKVTTDLLSHGTFGWSAEQILIDVFNTPTTRNLYLADKVGEILNLIAQPKQKEEEIKEKVRALEKYDFTTLSDADPFKSILNKIIKKYG